MISGSFGPNAHQALTTAGVAMYLHGDAGTARQAMERFIAGTLERAGEAAPKGGRRS